MIVQAAIPVKEIDDKISALMFLVFIRFMRLRNRINLINTKNNYMFRPIPAIIRFTPERVLVFIRFMRLHNRINLINTNTLSGVNLMMAGIGRNM